MCEVRCPLITGVEGECSSPQPSYKTPRILDEDFGLWDSHKMNVLHAWICMKERIRAQRERRPWGVYGAVTGRAPSSGRPTNT